MSSVTKIRRNKENQLERYNTGRINPNDTSFYQSIKNSLGELFLRSGRKNPVIGNAFQWNMPLLGVYETSETLSLVNWYGLKFSQEVLKCDWAILENINSKDIWSFYPTNTGIHQIGIIIKLIFADQDSADFFGDDGLNEFQVVLAINGTKLQHPIAWANAFTDESGLRKIAIYTSGTQNIWLNAGDRMNVYVNVLSKAGVELRTFDIYGQISGHWVTDKSRIINSQI